VAAVCVTSTDTRLRGTNTCSSCGAEALSAVAAGRPASSARRVATSSRRALILGYGGRQRLVDRVERLDYLCLLAFRRIRRVADALPALERVLGDAGLLPASRG